MKVVNRVARNLALRRFWLLAAVLCACGRAEQRATPHAVEPTIATFAQLSDAFHYSHVPKHSDLTGVWAEIRSIATLQFLEGRDGPDRVLFDSTGLKVEDAPGKPLSWTLTFAGIAPAKYVVTQRRGGQVSEPANVTVDSSGFFRFEPDFDADEAITYTCRVVQADRIICIDAYHPGAGSEFKQMSTVVPTRPPPFCPLPNVTECRGSGTAVDADQILADAHVCYHLLYPLTHRPEGVAGTDTWLALRGDSLPPIGTWQYAAIFDDSIVRVAAWRRTGHTPPLPKNAHPERPPQRDSLELRLTFAGTNVRGQLGYGDVGLEGTLFAEETPYSWGVEGERRACPSRLNPAIGPAPRPDTRDSPPAVRRSPA